MVSLNKIFLLQCFLNTTFLIAQNTCDVYLIQNHAALPQDVSSLGIKNGVNVMGSALRAGKMTTIYDFLNDSDAKIRTSFSNNMNTYFNGNLDTNALVILDMEHPVHPKYIGEEAKYHPALRDSIIIYGFKRRIDIARQVMPNAKIGLYGVFVPDAQGNIMKCQLPGYRRAKELGMFDSLDIICPVLYSRWHEDEDKLNKYAKQIKNAIDHARDSLQLNKEIMPLLSVLVYNGNSVKEREWISRKRAQETVDTVRAQPGVSRIGYWVANPYRENSDSINFFNWRDSLSSFFKDSLKLFAVADFNHSISNNIVTVSSNSQNAVSHFWDFGDGTTSTLQSPPSQQYFSPGVYIITLTVSDGNCDHTIANSVVISKLSSVEISQPQSSCIKIFPNPVSESLTISSVNNEELVEGIELTDSGGRVVSNTVIPSNISSITLDIKSMSLAAGIYTLKVQTVNNVQFLKIALNTL